MIRKPDGIRKYHTAHDRFLKPAIVNFFAREFSGFFGPVVRENIADALIELFEQNVKQTSGLKHGQMLWNALDKFTRADSSNRRYKPVILTLVHNEDIKLFEKQSPIKEIRKQVIAWLIKEAYAQGGILSMRDLSLILSTTAPLLSTQRAEYEKENNVVLPHTGVIHDMGSTITHKTQIVYKHVVEKKPTNIVARETNHSQKAVDHYIKDYHRVKTLFDDGKDIDFIHITTNIAKRVIQEYQSIINNNVNDL
ncbi:DUF1670 domain-containing protein [Parabacteroides sp. FAFU027]|uniref:DUF1670 domain-containing protein n=1 Tax=Parabacteroides sp. FAFU027 TaxID=2922715 RepID=UPI001FAE93A8|nr:DUF1670 domain-containing protein [Parabacteroides sp. FAFU027]